MSDLEGSNTEGVFPSVQVSSITCSLNGHKKEIAIHTCLNEFFVTIIKEEKSFCSRNCRFPPYSKNCNDHNPRFHYQALVTFTKAIFLLAMLRNVRGEWGHNNGSDGIMHRDKSRYG